MKIAVLTVAYNDDFKFDEWVKWFQEYKDAVMYHVIIDNGSNSNFLNSVKRSFSDSIIIENDRNLGSTGAYNKGIEYILGNTDAEYIALLGNDIRISSESLRVLAKVLQNDIHIGMVAPIMFYADANMIADYGCKITKELTLEPYRCGERYSERIEPSHDCEAVTGGANMASRHFYEKVGLQDDALFMYSDEVDMGIRAKKEGFGMMAVRDAQCWHQHINSDNGKYRKPYSSYLMARNKIYLAEKHNMNKIKMSIIILFFKNAIKKWIKGMSTNEKQLIDQAKYTFAGVANGIRGDMKPNKYTQY